MRVVSWLFGTEVVIMRFFRGLRKHETVTECRNYCSFDVAAGKLSAAPRLARLVYKSFAVRITSSQARGHLSPSQT